MIFQVHTLTQLPVPRNRLKHVGTKRPVLEQGTSNFPERSCITRGLWEKAYSQRKTHLLSWLFLPILQLSASAFSPKPFPGAVLRTSCSCFRRSDVPVSCLSNHSSLTSVFIGGHHHSYSCSLSAVCTISCANWVPNNIQLGLLVLSNTSQRTEF